MKSRNTDRAGLTNIFQQKELQLTVSPGKLIFHTTLLQAGVEYEIAARTPLLDFLCTCPGFSRQYIEDVVQTIFVDGNAVDDLEMPLTECRQTVALSAAMPGLAGAIFRKNSLHSSLRTPQQDRETTGENRQDTIQITLKLFNKILRDRGVLLLQSGVTLSSAAFLSFMRKRPELEETILSATLDQQRIHMAELAGRIQQLRYIKLRISEKTPPAPSGSTKLLQ